MGTGNDTPTLWHIPISHYSEKVRWALELKGVEHERRAPMPGAHMGIALALTGGRHATFPVLALDGKRIGDSTAIIAALEERFPEPALYPSDPDERRRALELEDWFDEELGPYIRTFVFHSFRSDPEMFDGVVASMMPRPLRSRPRVGGTFGRVFTGLRFAAGSRRRSDQGREKTLAALDRLEDELGDGDYLVGDRFTVADLTAAALFYGIAMPPEAPQVVDAPPERWEEFRAPLKDRRGYRWIEEMFRRHRKAHSAIASA
jgi:glutathione S-transferase